MAEALENDDPEQVEAGECIECGEIQKGELLDCQVCGLCMDLCVDCYAECHQHKEATNA